MLLERKVERMLPWIILLCIVGLALVFAEMPPDSEMFWYFEGVFVFGNGMFLVAKVMALQRFDYGCFAGHCFYIDDRSMKKRFYNKVVLRDKQEAQDFDESTLQGAGSRRCDMNTATTRRLCS